MKETKANHSQLKIEAHHCWQCGKPFVEGDEDLKKTMHHGIPQFLKPERNIQIPIHKKCHDEINKYNIQSIPQLKSLKGFIKSLKDFASKHEKILDRYVD